MSAIMNPARPNIPKAAIGILQGYENGRLDDRVLVRTTTRGLKMNAVSARKFNALTGICLQNGYAATSSGDIRTRAQQEQGLYANYDRGYIPGRADYNTYEGVVWSLKPGHFMFAVPGMSDHGWGRSRDWAELVNGTIVYPRPPFLRFLAQHAPRFGIYFDASSEDHHGTDYAGDNIPRAVLDWENGTGGGPTPWPPFIPEQGLFSLWPFNTGKATLRLTDPHMEGDAVSYMQGVMKFRLGYGIAVDGDYGVVTDDHVAWFQGANGLTIDRVCGPKTWARIDSYA